MPESQSHGFTIENEIKTKVFHLTETVNYTSVHDIPKEFNKLNNKENVSIKTTGSGTACMGCASRLFEYSSEDVHTAIIVQYKQDVGSKKIVGVFELDLNNRVALWGSVTLKEIQELGTLVRSMPSGKQRNAAITAAINNKKNQLNSKSGLVRFNPKIDSKNQRRLQCSIPRFAKSTIVTSSTKEASVRGIAITSELQSDRRVLKAGV
jgi:hypothetical protein